VKERQMEFDMDSDPEVMYDLFGEDAACFVEYVFHRFHRSHPLLHTSHLIAGDLFVFTSWKEGALLKSGRASWVRLIPK
jgi:hypothetical protein